jgi:hypothetical protein
MEGDVQQKRPILKYLPILGLGLLLTVMANVYLLSGENQAGTAFAESKRLEITDNGDCAACHGNDQVLPNGHVETKGLSGKTCMGCHSRKDQNLRGKVPLSHLHLWNGTSCRNCHGEATPYKALTTAQCISCHKSYPDVAKLTRGMAPNPHESHSGDIECGLCHKAHRKSESYCNKCHNFFDFRVP